LSREAFENGDDGSEPTFDGRRAYLKDEVVAVTVGYQAGYAVGLGVEETVDPGMSSPQPCHSPLRQHGCFRRGFRYPGVSPFTWRFGASC